MPNPELSLPQQYGRFLVAGALVFMFIFWGSSQVLIAGHDAHLDFLAAHLILKASMHQSFSAWLEKFETGYLPFFLHQRQLVACYMIAATLAWLAAFLHDTKIMRKENML
jgi:hypothetical protein